MDINWKNKTKNFFSMFTAEKALDRYWICIERIKIVLEEEEKFTIPKNVVFHLYGFGGPKTRQLG